MAPSEQLGLSPPSDAELLRRMRHGEATAFATVMRGNNRRLYRLACSILKDRDEAEEAVQEGYVRAFTRLDGFAGRASLATWLSRIVVNEALGRLRRRRGIPCGGAAGVSGDSANDAVIAPADPEQSAARREIRSAIERAVADLPLPFRAVFMLRAIEQLSVAETAACLEIREETVKTRLHRANRLLRQSLREHFGAIWDDAFPFAGGNCDRLVAAVLSRLASAGVLSGAAASA